MLTKSKYGHNVWTFLYPLRGLSYLWQRLTRGWDDTEIWSLDISTAQFLVPRLKRLKQLKHGYPADLSESEWNKAMDEMITAFELIATGDIYFSDENHERINNGLDQFRKYYSNLWD